MLRIPSSSPSDVLTCSTQCLNLFVQLNWTGPPNEEMELELETLVGKDGLCTLNNTALSELSVDGEVSSKNHQISHHLLAVLQAIYELCAMPLLLHISKLLLLSPYLLCKGNLPLVQRWAMRCMFIQQRLLENHSSSLWEGLSGLISKLEAMASSLSR